MNRLLIFILSAVVLVSGSAVTTLEVGIGKASNGEQVCVLIDGKGGLVATDHFALSDSAHEKRLTCKSVGVINTSGKIVAYDAKHNPFTSSGMIIPCFDGNGGKAITTSWKEVIKPSGDATLQCYFKK